MSAKHPLRVSLLDLNLDRFLASITGRSEITECHASKYLTGKVCHQRVFNHFLQCIRAMNGHTSAPRGQEIGYIPAVIRTLGMSEKK